MKCELTTEQECQMAIMMLQAQGATKEQLLEILQESLKLNYIRENVIKGLVNEKFGGESFIIFQ